MSPYDARVLPPPQPVDHTPNLWWWLGIGALALLVDASLHWPARTEAPAAAAPRAHLVVGGQDFLVLMLGKVGDGSPDALPPALLQAQLEELRAAGAHFVGVEDVRALLDTRARPLPDKAVLLAFDEAARETIDAVDPILAALNAPALAFISVEGVAAGNINLVSRRRLEQMMQSGRWSAGVGACRHDPDDFDAGAYQQRAMELRAWAAEPVVAISCSRWSGANDAPARWAAALSASSLSLGFVPDTAGANRRGDAPSALRFARVGAGERGLDALARRLRALASRDVAFEDRFTGPALDEHWVLASGRAHVASGTLQLEAEAGDTGTLTYIESARWRDARIEVDLDTLPAGQFWIYARHTGQKSFLRLGIVGGRVILQRSDAAGRTRQLGVLPAAHGRLRLALSVIGDRAVATVDDQPLTERPADLPGDLVEGPASLKVWGDDREAAVRLSRAALIPLARRVALLPAHPGDGSFERFRQQAGELWAVSPRRFRWQSGAGSEEATDTAVEILAGLNRIAMLPAVSVTQVPAGEEWSRLRAQMLQWAEPPQFAGLNLVVDRVEDADFGRIDDLRAALEGIGKQLVVTSPDDTGDLAPPPQLAWFIGPHSHGFAIATAAAQRVPG